MCNTSNFVILSCGCDVNVTVIALLANSTRRTRKRYINIDSTVHLYVSYLVCKVAEHVSIVQITKPLHKDKHVDGICNLLYISVTCTCQSCSVIGFNLFLAFSNLCQYFQLPVLDE